MAFWFLIFLFVALWVREAALRYAFRSTDLHKHGRNRFEYLNKFLDFTSIREGKRPVWATLDYWRMPKDAGMRVRLRVGLSGIVASFVFAWIVFTGLAFFNLPTVFDGQYEFESDQTVIRDNLTVVDVQPNTSGLPLVDPNAIPLTIGTEGIRDAAHFQELEQHFAGRSVEFEFLDTTGKRSVSLPLDEDGFSGVELGQVEVNRYGRSAPFVGLVTTGQLAYFTVSELWGGASDVGQGIDLLSNSQYLGFAYGFFMLGYISVVIGLINLLPIPPFDVGRIIAKGRGYGLLRRLKKKVSARSQS